MSTSKGVPKSATHSQGIRPLPSRAETRFGTNRDSPHGRPCDVYHRGPVFGGTAPSRASTAAVSNQLEQKEPGINPEPLSQTLKFPPAGPSTKYSYRMACRLSRVARSTRWPRTQREATFLRGAQPFGERIPYQSVRTLSKVELTTSRPSWYIIPGQSFPPT